mgnify:CR=1 FL=1
MQNIRDFWASIPTYFDQIVTSLATVFTGFVLGMGRLVAELNKGSLDGRLLSFADSQAKRIASEATVSPG